VLLALIAASAGFAADAGGIVLSDSTWDFGVMDQDDTAETSVSIENRTDRSVTVDLILTCGCLSVEPSRLQIPSGGTGAFRLVLDSEGEKGEIVRTLLIRTDSPALASTLFEVRGTVRGGGKVAARPRIGGKADASASKEWIVLTYYYSPGCPSCERFLADEVPRLARELGVEIEVRRRDVFAPGVFEEYEQIARSFGIKELRAFPALQVGDTALLQGEGEIGSNLEATLRGALPPAAAPEPGAALTVLPVLAGGLLDGINPCAFTTLIFMLSALVLAGRGRREVLAIGGFFSLAVFVTYFAVGLGLFTALRAASSFSVVSRVIRWVLVGVLVVFTTLSVRDAVLAYRGRSTEMALQLPRFLKRRIHASIRGRVRSTALVLSSLALGFLVSIFEFACTGQVYLPTLAYLSRIGQTRAVFLLAVYNLGFIAPLLAVFAASYAGVTSQRITVLFQRHLVAVKVAFALFFLALAALTLAT
jgi:cytochrome c biogenesis protein CcdA